MDNIDFEKLHTRLIEVDADNRALSRIVLNLEQENNHLRQVIEMLITSQSPTT